MSQQKLQQKIFGNPKIDLMQLDSSLDFQKKSYNIFLNKEFKEIFKSIFPISDYQNSKFNLEFISLEIKEEKHSLSESISRMENYAATFFVTLKFTNLVTKEKSVDEINFGEIPIMTPNHTFVINGRERTVISQIVKSHGFFFNSKSLQGINFFGMKAIPLSGRRLEIETAIGKKMYAKIDNKRKFPITQLIRFLFNETKTQILRHFDEKEQEYIKNTLLIDLADDPDDLYISMYRNIMGSDAISAEAAKNYTKTFFSKKYFDMGDVGISRLQNRLSTENKKIKKYNSVFDGVILVDLIKEIVRLNYTPGSIVDDIDHMSSKRVRLVGELVKNEVSAGLLRMKKNIQDRMNRSDVKKTTKSIQIINPRILEASVQSFFKSNSLSQFLRQTNILEEHEHMRRISVTGKGGLNKDRASFEVRDVHPSQYGRICPVHSPDSASIGLTLHLASYGQIDETGILKTPYAKVKNCKVTNEIEYLTSDAEELYKIIDLGKSIDKDGKIKKEKVAVRHRNQIVFVDASEVEYVDVSSRQIFSVSTSLIPFVHTNLAARATFGSTAQPQAVPCFLPEAPIVSSGAEEAIARSTGRMVVAEDNGTVVGLDSTYIKIKTKKSKEKTYKLNSFKVTNAKTISTQHTPIVSMGDEVKKGDVIADNATTKNGQLALGKNLRVAFMCCNGLNFEDSIVISERLVSDDVFTSIDLQDYTINVKNTKLGEEQTTSDIPNVGEARLRNLDSEGVVRVGAEVRTGDVLVGKITPQTETQQSAEDRLLQSIFGEKAKDIKDTSLRLGNGKSGRIVAVNVFEKKNGYTLEPDVIKKIVITIAEARKIQKGDKLTNRHGNKGVISKVLPVEDMPFTADGKPVDIILTPLGVPSRLNIGQILELHLGLAANTLNYQAVVLPMSEFSAEDLAKELKAAGKPASAKLALYDGKTGEKFQQDVAIGYMYILKLSHMVKSKVHMRAIGPYSLVSQQPLGGRARNGGHRFGEMEVWALLGHSAAYTLREMFTIKSDDVFGRSAAYSAIIKGRHITQINTPASFNVLVNFLKALGININFINDESIKPNF